MEIYSTGVHVHVNVHVHTGVHVHVNVHVHSLHVCSVWFSLHIYRPRLHVFICMYMYVCVHKNN